MSYYYPNRTLCAVLEAMRKAHETHNYSYLPSLIEEAQVYADRMEAALYDKKDFYSLQEEISKLKKQKKELENSIKEQGNE